MAIKINVLVFWVMKSCNVLEAPSASIIGVTGSS